jgi:hypothetical protein
LEDDVGHIANKSHEGLDYHHIECVLFTLLDVFQRHRVLHLVAAEDDAWDEDSND